MPKKTTTTHPDKRSIYLPPALWAEVESRNYSESVSGALGDMLTLYGELMARARAEIAPILTDDEMGAICDALNGVWLQEAHAIGVIWAEIADADSLDGLGKKWGIDGQALAQKIQAMTWPQKASIVDAVSRWWHRDDQPSTPHTVAELLK